MVFSFMFVNTISLTGFWRFGILCVGELWVSCFIDKILSAGDLFQLGLNLSFLLALEQTHLIYCVACLCSYGIGMHVILLKIFYNLVC